MKRLASILALVLLAHMALGQPYVGITGGWSASKAKLINPYMRTHIVYNGGPDYGLTFKYFKPNPRPDFYVEKLAGLQLELMLTHHGYRTHPQDSLELPYCRMNTYLMFPALAQFRFGMGRVAFIHINLGPYMAYMLNAQVGEQTPDGQFDMQPYQIKPLRDNRIDYGIIGGLGLGLELRWGVFQLEARYGYGLGDMFNVNYPNNHSQSPATFQSITLCYMLRLGKRQQP